ncbi:LysR family transcriptional regulator [Cryptosporangium aurantiacum]|uniref:DNA-binding transcriptional regulator, LysR family n=1 Tax=Cryptosporangium aurantiacum TaxID=134849 RepID=A0A1M7JST3_9ACTN|nr:LysR family transcriptional regulator [Cryptosporangium aurantiacum]SHM56129.1 DNA-binding transcriptional regulator, LysR family [Cryptosporangium aurantiacum]
MTLSQLRTFALVVRLGSLRAAAAELGVSEPAVSAAVAALRQELGDPLFVRAGGGIAFTPGGRRLAVHAEEIVGLADQARREVAETNGSTTSLRVAATSDFAEHAACALLDAFTRRLPDCEVELVVSDGAALGDALVRRAVDVVLGPRPGSGGFDAVPFLRYQRILVASPDRPLPELSLGAALRQVWLTGPAGLEELSEEGRWLAGQSAWPDLVRFPSETEAVAAARAGDGVMLALGHVVRADLRHGTLVRLPVPGTPVQGLWYATLLGRGRASAAARALQQFVTTPGATAAMLAPPGAAPTAPRRPPVHVALWS